ncbi:MAG: uracil-DNA glycosylase [Spirochaetaceae bacterium]
MSDNFARQLYELIEDTEDLISRGYRRKRTPFDPLYAAPEASAAVASAAVAGDGEPSSTLAGSEDGSRQLSREQRLRRVEARISSCTACRLHEGRSRAVAGMGVLDPEVMVIGEGPGAEEDRQGLPFVGPAGQYLDKWLEAIGLDRNTNAYIANVVKCRPPNNRDPHPDEASTCLPYLEEQIALVRPRAILAVGRVALRFLIGETAPIGTIHGNLYEYRGIPLMATYHPSGVLRNPEYRRPVWEDLKKLRDQVLRPKAGE